MPRPRTKLVIAGVVLAAAGCAGLAWIDVLPGGWTLRGWVKPHAEREAERWAAYRAERLAEFASEPPAPTGSVVFLGSSTIERFPLESAFPNRTCLNRGIGNEPLLGPHGLEARLDECLPATVPAGVVFYAGSVDHRFRDLPPWPLATRVDQLIKRTRARYPESEVPIVVIGLLPELGMQPGAVEALAGVNGTLRIRVSPLAGVTFVDTNRPPIRAHDGSLSPDCAADRLHLNENGYAALASWLIEDGGPLGEFLGTP